MPQLSIIIPTLNEEACLKQTLKLLQKLEPPPQEIIIADGGSTDRTTEIAARFQVKLIEVSKKSRAMQMNAGTEAAASEYLCFLHADTRVPSDLVHIVQKTLSDSKTSLAGFVSIMGQEGKTHYFTTYLNYVKTFFGPLIYSPYQCIFKGLRLLFGDQAMFCRKADFLKAGGFDAELSIMEEADLCKKMNTLGKIRQIHRCVYTSDRRIAHWGFWKAHFVYLSIFFFWMLHVPNHQLKRFYKEVR